MPKKEVMNRTQEVPQRLACTIEIDFQMSSSNSPRYLRHLLIIVGVLYYFSLAVTSVSWIRGSTESTSLTYIRFWGSWSSWLAWTSWISVISIFLPGLLLGFFL